MFDPSTKPTTTKCTNVTATYTVESKSIKQSGTSTFIAALRCSLRPFKDLHQVAAN